MTKSTIWDKNDQVQKFICSLIFFIKVDRIIIVDDISWAACQNIKNVIAQYLNLHLKTLKVSNSKLLFCDLVIFSSKLFNCKGII